MLPQLLLFARHTDPMLVQCWDIVFDAVSTLNQHWVSVSFASLYPPGSLHGPISLLSQWLLFSFPSPLHVCHLLLQMFNHLRFVLPFIIQCTVKKVSQSYLIYKSPDNLFLVNTNKQRPFSWRQIALIFSLFDSTFISEIFKRFGTSVISLQNNDGVVQDTLAHRTASQTGFLTL